MMSVVIVKHLLDSQKDRKSLKLYLVKGFPGSGKSWKGYELLNDGSVDEVIEADQFMYEEKDGEMVYKWHTDKVRPAHNDCRLRTLAALENGKSVAVCNTFVARWQMQPYIEFAEKNDIQLEVISIGDSGYDDSGLFRGIVFLSVSFVNSWSTKNLKSIFFRLFETVHQKTSLKTCLSTK